MKVLALSEVTRSAGGLFYAVRSLCQSIHAEGLNIRVVGRKGDYLEEDLPSWDPVDTRAYDGYGPMGTSPGLRKELKSVSEDLIHVHGLWMDEQWAAYRWGKRTGKPVVLSPHGMLDPWAVANSSWKKKLVGMLFANRSFQQATCVHALCESEAESIRSYGIKVPIAVIPNGVDLPVVGTLSSGQSAKKKLLFLGRIHPKKGIEHLIQGWAEAALPDWELQIAGWDDGEHETALKEMAQSGRGESITFLGPKFGEEKEALFRSADAFILPSYSEGLPISVLEAWSYELPVLMTDFCNIPEGFSAEAAVRVEPNDAAVYRGLVALAALTQTERVEMGKRGRKLVEEQFTWERVAKEMAKVYAWCSGGDEPACIQKV